MHIRYLNTVTGKQFTVNASAKKYVEQNSSFKFLNYCHENGDVIEGAEFKKPIDEPQPTLKLKEEIKAPVEEKPKTKAQLKKEKKKQEEEEQASGKESFDFDDED